MGGPTLVAAAVLTATACSLLIMRTLLQPVAGRRWPHPDRHEFWALTAIGLSISLVLTVNYLFV